jgi:hypothetical protein
MKGKEYYSFGNIINIGMQRAIKAFSGVYLLLEQAMPEDINCN